MGSMGWMALWWVVGAAVLLLMVWMLGRIAGGPGRSEDSPEQILKRRYARGEIDAEEYERRLDGLRR
jgi:putative membrane protein